MHMHIGVSLSVQVCDTISSSFPGCTHLSAIKYMPVSVCISVQVYDSFPVHGCTYLGANMHMLE